MSNKRENKQDTLFSAIPNCGLCLLAVGLETLAMQVATRNQSLKLENQQPKLINRLVKLACVRVMRLQPGRSTTCFHVKGLERWGSCIQCLLVQTAQASSASTALLQGSNLNRATKHVTPISFAGRGRKGGFRNCSCWRGFQSCTYDRPSIPPPRGLRYVLALFFNTHARATRPAPTGCLQRRTQLPDERGKNCDTARE